MDDDDDWRRHFEDDESEYSATTQLTQQTGSHVSVTQENTTPQQTNSNLIEEKYDEEEDDDFRDLTAEEIEEIKREDAAYEASERLEQKRREQQMESLRHWDEEIQKEEINKHDEGRERRLQKAAQRGLRDPGLVAEAKLAFKNNRKSSLLAELHQTGELGPKVVDTLKEEHNINIQDVFPNDYVKEMDEQHKEDDDDGVEYANLETTEPVDPFGLKTLFAEVRKEKEQQAQMQLEKKAKLRQDPPIKVSKDRGVGRNPLDAHEDDDSDNDSDGEFSKVTHVSAETEVSKDGKLAKRLLKAASKKLLRKKSSVRSGSNSNSNSRTSTSQESPEIVQTQNTDAEVQSETASSRTGSGMFRRGSGVLGFVGLRRGSETSDTLNELIEEDTYLTERASQVMQERNSQVSETEELPPRRPSLIPVSMEATYRRDSSVSTVKLDALEKSIEDSIHDSIVNKKQRKKRPQPVSMVFKTPVKPEPMRKPSLKKTERASMEMFERRTASVADDELTESEDERNQSQDDEERKRDSGRSKNPLKRASLKSSSKTKWTEEDSSGLERVPSLQTTESGEDGRLDKLQELVPPIAVAALTPVVRRLSLVPIVDNKKGLGLPEIAAGVFVIGLFIGAWIMTTPIKSEGEFCTGFLDSCDVGLECSWFTCSTVLSEPSAWLRPVDDQGQCGACWAFAAVHAYNDRLVKQKKVAKGLKLSVQNVMQCTYDQSVDPCNGGFATDAIETMLHLGVHTERQEPYIAQHSGTCYTSYTPRYFPAISEYSQRDEEEIMQYIKTHGPLVATFLVYENFFTFFNDHPKGIYSQVEGMLMAGHAVELVGYGTKNNIPYWLLKNSWGPEWGNKGYFKVKRGQDIAGIESRMFTRTRTPLGLIAIDTTEPMNDDMFDQVVQKRIGSGEFAKQKVQSIREIADAEKSADIVLSRLNSETGCEFKLESIVEADSRVVAGSRVHVIIQLSSQSTSSQCSNGLYSGDVWYTLPHERYNVLYTDCRRKMFGFSNRCATSYRVLSAGKLGGATIIGPATSSSNEVVILTALAVAAAAGAAEYYRIRQEDQRHERTKARRKKHYSKRRSSKRRSARNI